MFIEPIKFWLVASQYIKKGVKITTKLKQANKSCICLVGKRQKTNFKNGGSGFESGSATIAKKFHKGAVNGTPTSKNKSLDTG